MDKGVGFKGDAYGLKLPPRRFPLQFGENHRMVWRIGRIARQVKACHFPPLAIHRMDIGILDFAEMLLAVYALVDLYDKGYFLVLLGQCRQVGDDLLVVPVALPGAIVPGKVNVAGRMAQTVEKNHIPIFQVGVPILNTA